MSITTAANLLNGSNHTLRDLRRFAKADPEAAKTYLQTVGKHLKALDEVEASGQIEALLKQGDAWVQTLASSNPLSMVFPQRKDEWGKRQEARAATIGYDVVDEKKLTPATVRGTVSYQDGKAQLTTESGRTLALAASPRARMTSYFLQGLVSDGPMVLQGTLGKDGKSFNVEGFALNRDGRYDTFTTGRTAVEGDTVTLQTSRGAVRITDEHFAKVLKQLPNFGLILPGEPTKKRGKLTYDGNPEQYFGLARFMGTTVMPPDETSDKPYVPTDMAFSSFSQKPCTMPDEFASRATEPGRIWVEGKMELGADGTPSRFQASYVSLQTDVSWDSLHEAQEDADPVRAAVMLTEAQ